MKMHETKPDYHDWEARMRNFACELLDLVHPDSGDALPKGLCIDPHPMRSLEAARGFFGPQSCSYWEAIHFLTQHPYTKGERNDPSIP